MAAARLSPGRPVAAVIDLGEANATEIVARMRLTEPRSFFARTHQFGDSLGIQDDRRLVAMTRERLKSDGYTEVSGGGAALSIAGGVMQALSCGW